MATIADLLTRLEHDAVTLGPSTVHADPDAHSAGWMLLARRTLHAVDQLPLGGRPEQVGIGIRAVLQPLIDGPRRGLPADTRPALELAQLALTMGAISDVLADTLRTWRRSEYIGREAAKLEASLLAPVHLAARWSRQCLENQQVPRNRVSIRGMLEDLSGVTETWALIPPANRGGALADFRIRSTMAGGLEGTATSWADEALLVLTERQRTSGWAMQAIAGQLALIAQTAYAATRRVALDPNVADLEVPALKSLAGAISAWRAAATWPSYLRLGGSSPGLRALTRELQRQAVANPPQNLADTRNLLRLALPVSETHVITMKRLAEGQELWVHAPSLGSSAGHIRGWEREPSWSNQGMVIVSASRKGRDSLDRALIELATWRGRTEPIRAPLGWPPHIGLYEARKDPGVRRLPDPVARRQAR